MNRFKKEFYTVQEVAGALAISTRTAHRMLDAGELPWVPFGKGKLRRVPCEDFDAYVEARKEDARSQQETRKVVPFHARLDRQA